MYFKKILLFFFTLIVITAQAQEISNSAVAEQKSLDLYLDKDWKQLSPYGEKAIGKGYDYFYMRMRVGVAFYEQHKYIKAIKHFEKAVAFNADTLALEYLYYSYLFSGRGNEARALTASFPETMCERLKLPKNKALESVNAEGGILLTNLPDLLRGVDIDGKYNIYGESTLMKNMTYFHVGTCHQLGRKWSAYEGYSHIGIDVVKNIRINNKDNIDPYHLVQHDYYISATGQLKHFSISPAFHFINVNFDALTANYNVLSNKYIFIKKDTSFINYALSLSLSKSIGVVTYGLCGSYGHLNGYTQIQTGLSATYYPFANPDLYGTTMFVVLDESGKTRYIVSQKAGYKMFHSLWAEAGITYGKIQNYCENNAFVIFNTGDKILYKYGVALIVPITNHLQLSLRYDLFRRENAYYQQNDVFSIVPVKTDYNTQTIVGGIKWIL